MNGRPTRQARLNDQDAILLSLVLQLQPASGYRVCQAFDHDFTTKFSGSKGKVYPIIARLQQRGLIEKRAVANDQRGTEHLYCTKSGSAAVRHWLLSFPDADILQDDALRARINLLHLLTGEERADWVAQAREHLQRQLARLLSPASEPAGLFARSAVNNAIYALEGQLYGLDELMAALTVAPRPALRVAAAR